MLRKICTYFNSIVFKVYVFHIFACIKLNDMKRHFFLILFLCLAVNVFAQSDSLAFVNGPWLSERVDGLVMRRCQFEQGSLFASNQHIMVWELYDNDATQVHRPFRIAMGR